MSATPEPTVTTHCLTHRRAVFKGTVSDVYLCMGGLRSGDGKYDGSCVPAVLVPVTQWDAVQRVVRAAERRWLSGHGDLCPKRPCECGHAAIGAAVDELAEARHG